MDFHPVEQNLRQMFRVLASRRQSGETRELPGVTIASLGSSFQMFNAAFFHAPIRDETDFLRQVNLASVQMRVRGLPWAFWLCEDWLPFALRRRVVKILDRQGLSLASEMPGMVAEALRPPQRSLPGMRIQPLSNEPARQAFCQIGAVCFHVPLMWFDEIFDEQTPLREECAGWVGYLDGQPVATAATVVHGGVIGVYNIATLPEFRERGLGEAIMRHAIQAAKEKSGLDRTILQATRQGLHLYESMGYRSVTRFLVFTSR
jgi:ribosomal protein S18 acetylase RimI-like enzyme